MSVYEMILENAPKQIPKAAGDLHEAIWEELLRAEDPILHNVRLTRGDGGIDGVVFGDPKYGGNTVYQAKFFRDITTSEHQEEVLKSFIAAHKHGFDCNQWILLIPFDLSHKELSWLMTALKIEAKRKLPRCRQKKINSCHIDFRDGSQMISLLRNNLNIAYQRLPKSSLALESMLEAEKEWANTLEKEVSERLRDIHKEIIRAREVESRRTVAFLKILNQGWANYLAMFNRELTTSRRNPSNINSIAAKIEKLAKELSEFSRQKIEEAAESEGLVNGITSIVAEIHCKSRKLIFIAISYQSLNKWPGTVEMAMKDIVSTIKNLQRCIGKVLSNL